MHTGRKACVAERGMHAHVITSHKVQPEWHLLDRRIGREDALVALIKNHVGLLVVALEHALSTGMRAR